MKRFVLAAVLLAAAAPAAAIGSSSFNQLSKPSGGGTTVGGGLASGGFVPIYNDRGVLPAGSVVPVPEPGEWAMMMVGLAAVGFVARKRR